HGSLGTGKVTASLNAGSWNDSDGNLGQAAQRQFALITQAASFFIQISGGVILAAGDTKLMEANAEVELDIDTDRKVFPLPFDGSLWIIGLGTVGAPAGRFILESPHDGDDFPRFWGVATIETNFSALEPYGIFLSASGTLQINQTGDPHKEVL